MIGIMIHSLIHYRARNGEIVATGRNLGEDDNSSGRKACYVNITNIQAEDDGEWRLVMTASGGDEGSDGGHDKQVFQFSEEIIVQGIPSITSFIFSWGYSLYKNL